MSRVVKLGQVKTPTRSPGYIGFYPGMQAGSDTNLTDRSGAGNNATFGSDLTIGEAWATAGRFSTVEDTGGTQNNAANLSNGVGFNFNPATESLLIFAKVTITAPAGTRPLVGNSNGTPNKGFGLKVTAAGKARFDLHRTGADTIINTSSATLADASLHSFALALDAIAKTATVYIDGVVDTNFVGGSNLSAYSDWYGPFTRDFCIGGAGHNSSKSISMAQTGFGWHIVKRTGAMPSNIASLVARLHAFPLQLISATDFPA